MISLNLLPSKYLSTNIQIIVSAKSSYSYSPYYYYYYYWLFGCIPWAFHRNCPGKNEELKLTFRWFWSLFPFKGCGQSFNSFGQSFKGFGQSFKDFGPSFKVFSQGASAWRIEEWINQIFISISLCWVWHSEVSKMVVKDFLNLIIEIIKNRLKYIQRC